MNAKRVITLLQSISESVHEYSSIQANLPPEIAVPILEFGRTIPDAWLSEQGRDTTPHITVLYGLSTEDPEAVRTVLQNEPAIRATLGVITSFSSYPAAQDGSAVLRVDVESRDLHYLHEKLLRAIPDVTMTFPVYRPHVTIAYMQPQFVARFTGDTLFKGKSLVIPEVQFSSKDGTITTIPLQQLPVQAMDLISA